MHELKSLFRDTLNTAFNLFKIMIPVSLAVKLAEQFHWISVLGDWLAPLMKAVGLPGESGLVWASTMITNIYGGMITFYSLPQSHAMTTAQMSVLASLMLVAHTLPVELQVARQAGVRLPVMFIIRFGFALLTGYLMHALLQGFGWLQEPNTVQWQPEVLLHPGWKEWLLGELKKYVMVFFAVMALLLLMRLLKRSGTLDALSEALKPVLGMLGINKEVIPMTVIGLSMGILYGGALIIKETKEKDIPPRDVLYAFVLMGLCHSLIEDSLLLMSMGAHWTMVFLFRIVFALSVTFLFVKGTRYLPDSFIQKIFCAPVKRSKPD